MTGSSPSGKRRWFFASAVCGMAAVAFAGYVYAGAPKSSAGGAAMPRRQAHVDPAVVGTLSPRVLRILRDEGYVDASIYSRAAITQRSDRGGPAPGVTAGVHALAAPGAATSPVPPEVRSFVTHSAQMTRSDPEKALADVRPLRRMLGGGQSAVWAYRSAAGAPCFILTGYGGACAQSPADGMPGLHWMLGGGHDRSPSVLAGIASDDVARVELRVDGAPVPVSLSNNVVFAEFAANATEAAIVVVHKDGSTSRASLRL
jgi:hypothetical protein